MNIQFKEKDTENALVFVSTAFVIAMVVILSIALFTGCKKADDLRRKYDYNHSPGATASGSGQYNNFNLRMTDAPGNYDAVFVEIIGAEVHNEDSGWMALNVKSGIYNLLDLTNGKDTLIANGHVAVGVVSQVRLILGSNNSVVVDGTTYPLSTPSGQQSGLKLQVHTELIKGVTYTMLLDFDANKSIVKAGKGKYSLKPVIRVISKALDGAITGIVAPLAARPAVLAISGTDTFSTAANLLGGFYIGGLYAGSYKVLIMPKTPYGDTAITGVNVSLGAVTDIGIVTVK